MGTEVNIRNIIPEITVENVDTWFFLDHTKCEHITCPGHQSSTEQTTPVEKMLYDHCCSKKCMVCSANDVTRLYMLHPPESQRNQVIKRWLRQQRTY